MKFNSQKGYAQVACMLVALVASIGTSIYDVERARQARVKECSSKNADSCTKKTRDIGGKEIPSLVDEIWKLKQVVDSFCRTDIYEVNGEKYTGPMMYFIYHRWKYCDAKELDVSACEFSMEAACNSMKANLKGAHDYVQSLVHGNICDQATSDSVRASLGPIYTDIALLEKKFKEVLALIKSKPDEQATLELACKCNEVCLDKLVP